AVTTKKIERAPTQGFGTSCPAFIEEASAVVHELPPLFRGHGAGRARIIQPSKSLCPLTRDAARVLGKGGALLFEARSSCGRRRKLSRWCIRAWDGDVSKRCSSVPLTVPSQSSQRQGFEAHRPGTVHPAVSLCRIVSRCPTSEAVGRRDSYGLTHAP